VAAWERYDGADEIVQAAGYDGAGPQLGALSIPATGTVGQTLSFSVSPFDVWSAVGATTWSFGDGSGAGGTGVTHTYTAPGTYTVTASALDALRNGTSAGGRVTITAAPAIPGVPSRPGAGRKARASVGRLVEVKSGKALVKLRCPAGAGCQGVLRLTVVLKKHGTHGKGRSVGIGKTAFKVAAGKAKTVPVKLSAKGIARVRATTKSGGLKAQLAGAGVAARTVVLKETRRR
jgi:hypothetical protein